MDVLYSVAWRIGMFVLDIGFTHPKQRLIDEAKIARNALWAKKI